LFKLLLVSEKKLSQHWFLRKTPTFSQKIGKNCRNCDHNIDPRSFTLLVGKFGQQRRKKTWSKFRRRSLCFQSEEMKKKVCKLCNYISVNANNKLVGFLKKLLKQIFLFFEYMMIY
jgi:hypothetical protein